MPFTLSHIAGIYPVQKITPLRDHLDALIIGSILPDLIYFFPFGLDRSYSHSKEGVLFFYLPIGLLFIIYNRMVLKDAFYILLPNFIRMRLKTASKSSLSKGGVFFTIVSLGIGVGGHLTCDAFTHGDYIFRYLSPNGYNFYFQFYSSVIGIILLGVWIIRWLLTAEVDWSKRKVSDYRIWLLRFFVFVFPFLLSLGGVPLGYSTKRYIVRYLANLFIYGGGETFLIVSLLYTFIYAVAHDFINRKNRAKVK